MFPISSRTIQVRASFATKFNRDCRATGWSVTMLNQFGESGRSAVIDQSRPAIVWRSSMLACLLVAISIAAPANAQEQTDKFLCLIQPKMTLKLGTQVPGLI